METQNPSETPLIYPAYFRTVRREPGAWHFQKTSVFYNPRNLPVFSTDDKEEGYGLTKEEVAIELFRINGGRAGWYLANLRDKKYYYCGEVKEDVRLQLQALGIGKPDPIEG